MPEVAVATPVELALQLHGQLLEQVAQ